jgi:hypothetical protein
MKSYLILLMLLPTWGIADYLAVEDGGDDAFVGPTKEAIELIAVNETPPYGSSHPLSARIRNNASAYLDRLSIDCTISDDRGFRVFKGIVFKSAPAFSIRLALPPISTPEQGIPPGAVAEVGLYTKDNRWIRGEGSYRYDCRIYSVGGRE